MRSSFSWQANHFSCFSAVSRRNQEKKRQCRRHVTGSWGRWTSRSSLPKDGREFSESFKTSRKALRIRSDLHSVEQLLRRHVYKRELLEEVADWGPRGVALYVEEGMLLDLQRWHVDQSGERIRLRGVLLGEDAPCYLLGTRGRPLGISLLLWGYCSKFYRVILNWNPILYYLFWNVLLYSWLCFFEIEMNLSFCLVLDSWGLEISFIIS